MTAGINDLKKQVFYEMLNLAGRVFVLVGHSEDVIIGTRGFLPEEREKGLVLVFNNRMNFEWNNLGITAKLVFGTKSESCFIPNSQIHSVFSPELYAQFSVSPGKESLENKESRREKKDPPRSKKADTGKKVVRVDFNRKK